MGSTVAVCIPVLDDLESLRVTIPYTKRWADQVVIVDSGSTDGGKEFLKWFLEPQDRIIEHPDDLGVGMDALRNLAASEATTDWIFAMDADCMLKPGDVTQLRLCLESPDPVLRVQRLYCEFSADFTVLQAEKALETMKLHSEDQDWLYRKNSGLQFKGYIHETLINRPTEVRGSGVTLYHFVGIKGPAKAGRSAYRLKKVVVTDALKDGVNPYWYGEYYNRHKAMFDDIAGDYADRHGLPRF